jgi:UDP-N-acetylmuramyl pentapeptide phosphotransferase/UDP-N-acetylglucosamine-1-phosphate transferase
MPASALPLSLPVAFALVLVAAASSYGLCLALRPLFARYALARPNARSSHKVPTPQGGGIPVICAVLVGIAAALPVGPGDASALKVLAGATVCIGLLGAWDDVRPLSATVRLAVQGLCVAAVVVTLPHLGLSGGVLPAWIETALIILAGLWFVNLTNFMDGLDAITVAAFVPLALGSAVILMLAAQPGPACVGLGLAAGLIGFLPFNRPVARLFLGDVGALAIGLIGAWLLYQVALHAGLMLAIALPFYHLADATMTLLKRLARGEKVWEAHRSHAYQQATDHGFSVAGVSGRVAVANALVALAAIGAALARSDAAKSGVLLLAVVLAGWLIVIFTRSRRPGA